MRTEQLIRRFDLRAALALQLLGLSLALACGACGTKEAPRDCGDDSMSIVVLSGRTSAEDDAIPSCIDLHVAARLDASRTSAGRDGSHPISAPGVVPWTNLTFADAVAACGRAGKVLCSLDELKAITEVRVELATATPYGTVIEAVPPNSDVASVPSRFDVLNRFDMVVRGETGKPPFPESNGSVVVWAAPNAIDYTDKEGAEDSVPRVLGVLEERRAHAGNFTVTEVGDDFKHPLLGFRCCVHSKLRDVFTPLEHDPSQVLEREDPDVPIGTEQAKPDATR